MSTDLNVQLLTALERSGPNPALAWYGEAARIELSGHVLANWVIKTIGHLHDEVALDPGDQVVLDLPAHWKRLVLALAAWSLGAEVTMLDEQGAANSPDAAISTGAVLPEGADLSAARPAGAPADVPSAPRVVATDRPESALAESADELLVLEAVSLAPRYSGQLPPLAHDWVSEVRAHPDQLGVNLPAWSGPLPGQSGSAASTPPRLLVPGDGCGAMPAVLRALLAGGGIVGPAEVVTERQAADEVVTGTA
ncbi:MULTISPECIES: TIGR03089 family protein [unclassified Brachybacterium]|uniref:TIGR03089 family protein n=1 Tax=unclassified Brachybacterium TaxID=2623841 RepID=UPI0040346B16